MKAHRNVGFFVPITGGTMGVNYEKENAEKLEHFKEKLRQHLTHGAAAVGIGSIICAWVIVLCSRQLPRMNESFVQMTAQSKLTGADIIPGWMLLIGVCGLFAAAVLAARGWKNVILWLTAAFLALMDGAGILVCIIRGRMIPSVMLVFWLSMMFFVWHTIKLFVRLAVWVKSTRTCRN